MIVDSLHNSAAYEALHPLFTRAFAFIKSIDPSNLPLGRSDIDGDNLYLIHSEIGTKEPQEAIIESHQAYIDIQMPLTLPENIGWISLDKLGTPREAYCAENDIVFFNEVPTAYITLTPGEFAIFFPKDGHAPGITPSPARKIVVKVKV